LDSLFSASFACLDIVSVSLRHEFFVRARLGVDDEIRLLKVINFFLVKKIDCAFL
jgi:hypothetical protein